ncbi:MAG: PBSX family phage terminase large subunit [Pseudomonadota bacterium]
MTPSLQKIEAAADFPRVFDFLLQQKARNKGVYSGRGAAKSWSFATALLILAGEERRRVVGARETQRSIEDSVHALLGDRIRDLNLGAFYEVRKKSIYGRNGSEFLFHGLRHDPAAIKSLEGADYCWIEEAQSVGKESWEMVIPTIRKPGSEIWASWNPRLETDAVHQRYVIHPAPGTICRKVSWRDNPWFPNELRIEKDHLKAIDPQAYQHVWEGECKAAVEGAVYAAELDLATRENRITTVSVDRKIPVHTFWDLGFGDATAIWFAQALPTGQTRIVDYLEAHGKTLDWYVIQLNQRAYMYGEDWLPHDGVDCIIHSRFSGDKSRSPEQLMRAAGRKVRIAPKLHVASGINAVRTMFSSCWFDETRCGEGLQALRHYQWGVPAQNGAVKREPLHDWASHGADALRTLAVSIKAPEVKTPARREQRVVPSPWS